METNKTEGLGCCSMASIRYAKVLFELGIAGDVIENARTIVQETPELQGVLGNPVVEKERKHKIIDRVFPKEIRSFMKVVTDYGKIDHINEIFLAYEENKNKMAGIVTVKLTYVTPPTDQQQKGMEQFICKEFSAAGVIWERQERPELIGGFKLYVNGREYDYSVQGRMNRLEQKLTWR